MIEADSSEYHALKGAFELDRRQQNRLMLSGYRVPRFTGPMITDDPAQVMGAIRTLRRQLAGPDRQAPPIRGRDAALLE